MLRPEHLKVAVVMMNRAPLKGEEADAVAETKRVFIELYQQMTAVPTQDAGNEEEDGDDA
jgi:hypothetical protein